MAEILVLDLCDDRPPRARAAAGVDPIPAAVIRKSEKVDSL
jgi:hypothetical protein